MGPLGDGRSALLVALRPLIHKERPRERPNAERRKGVPTFLFLDPFLVCVDARPERAVQA